MDSSARLLMLVMAFQVWYMEYYDAVNRCFVRKVRNWGTSVEVCK